MCMIAYRPIGKSGRGSNIPNEVIDTAQSRHPDGFGIAWREDGQLHVQRFGPSERREFRDLLKEVDRKKSEYVSHFRFATHGPKDAAHAHPYEYEDPNEGRVLVFHNGIIDIATLPSESDTEVFVRDVLAQLPSKWWADPALKYLVHEAIGWSKLVIMTPTETVNLQDARGDWDAGIWYSSDHLPYKWGGKAVGTVKGSGLELVSSGKGMDDIHVYQPAEWARNTSYRSRVLRHGGHDLWVIDNEADIELRVDGAYADSVMCCVCYTPGDVYIVDGAPMVEMAHKMGTSLIGAPLPRNSEDDDEDDDEDERAARMLDDDDLLPVTRAVVKVN